METFFVVLLHNRPISKKCKKECYVSTLKASTSMNDPSNHQRSSNSGGKISRSNSSNHVCSPSRIDVIDNRSYKNRTRNMNWLFLKACIGKQAKS